MNTKMTTTTPLTKWAEKILFIFAEQLAFRGRLPFLNGDRTATVKEKIGKDDDDEVTKATVSFRLDSMDLERMCGYKLKTPFKDIIRSVVKTKLICCFNGRCVSLTREGLVELCSSSKTFRIPKFSSNEDMRRYLLTHKISNGSQTILFNYLWDDGQYKTYRQLADHLSHVTRRCYDPTTANFKSIIRELRRKADVVEHKLVGQKGTDAVRILRHFYHIGGPPSPTSSNSVDAISAAVKQEDCTTVKLEASLADRRRAASNSNRTNSSSASSNTSTVKEESSTGTKKRALTAHEKQDEYRRKQQEHHEPTQKKQRIELTLQSCQPVDQNLKRIGGRASRKSSRDSTRMGSLEGHSWYVEKAKKSKDTILNDEEKKKIYKLNGDEKKMIDKFEQYLYEVDGITEANRLTTTMQAMKMLAGVGVKWRIGKDKKGNDKYQYFLQGQKIDFLTSNFDALKTQFQWLNGRHRDKSNGWNANHPLGKLENFQEHCKKNPDFLTKQPARDLSSSMAKSTIERSISSSSPWTMPESNFDASMSRETNYDGDADTSHTCVGGGIGSGNSSSQKKKNMSQMELFHHHRYTSKVQQQKTTRHDQNHSSTPRIKAEPDDASGTIPDVEKAVIPASTSTSTPNAAHSLVCSGSSRDHDDESKNSHDAGL
mmetsp:Transcript_24699/g.58617  ORF Transcript_24699/g.58617 Transcript_24699/m.58617 type:complete len:656 (+) Transcript_24699:1416-3383(+)